MTTFCRWTPNLSLIGRSVDSEILRNFNENFPNRTLILCIFDDICVQFELYYFLKETCRCNKLLRTNWRQLSPYVSDRNSADPPLPSGILPTIINDMAVSCCQSCQSHGESVLDFNLDGEGGQSEKSNDAALREAISERTELNFPIPGYMEQERFGAGHGYWPVVQTPGVAHIVNTADGYSPSNALNNTLVSCWAALLLVFVMSLLSGFLMWILVIFAVVQINKTLI